MNKHERVQRAVVGFFLSLDEATVRWAVRSEAEAEMLASELTNVIFTAIEAGVQAAPAVITGEAVKYWHWDAHRSIGSESALAASFLRPAEERLPAA